MHERDILLAALEKVQPAEREAYLTQACGQDTELRSRVDALLRASEVQDSFLEHPAAETQLFSRETDGIRSEIARHDELSLDFLQPADESDALGRLGHYQITEVIGRGGMGVVLKARDTKLNRIVAIKVLAPELASNSTARKRFQREAHAAAAVVHQHIVTIHAVEEDRPPYLVMECIVGQSLKEKIDREGHLQLVEILRIGQQVAAGLSAAHAHGLIHRDVKPANILLENGVQRVRITDFGLARAVDDVSMTRTGEVAGTPQFMSPEQAQGLPLDHRSDLFSFGSVLYDMCTGRPPFRAETSFATARRVCEDTPRPISEVNPEIPDWLLGIVDRLLSKNPAERFQSAKEVADLLGQYLAHAQQPAIVPFPGSPAVSKNRRSLNLLKQWSFAVVTVLAVIALGFGLTEASGVTSFVPTVVRIVRGEGTLVIEVHDPEVQVSLDGEELSIRGAGLQEFRLIPGKYRVHATKDGQPVKDEVVTISRDDREVVTVTRESLGGPASSSAAPVVELPVGELKLLEKLDWHAGLVRAVAFLPDGRRVVSVGHDNMVLIWDMANRSVLATLPVEGNLVTADVTADGRLVATLRRDGSKGLIRICDMEKREVVCEFAPELNFDNFIRFSPDGTRLVTSGSDMPYAVLSDAATGMELGRFDMGNTKGMHRAAFSPNGRMLALGAVGRVRLFDVGSGKVMADVQLPHPWNVWDLAFAPGGKTLATGQGGGNLSFIDLDSRRVINRLIDSNAQVNALRFLGNDRFLLTSSYDAILRVWDLEQGRVVARAATGNGTNRGLFVSPDGRQVITAGGKEWDDASQSMKDHGDYALRLWQLPESVWPAEQLKLLTKFDGHTDVVRTVAFLPDGRKAVSVGRDKTVRVWDLESRSAHSILPVEGFLANADVSADGRLVATIWNGPDKKRVAQVWDLEKRSLLGELPQESSSVNTVRLSPDGTKLVTTGKPPGGMLWDLASGKESRRLDLGDTFSAPVQAAFSHNGRILALGAVGRVRLFDVETGDVLGDVPLPHQRHVNDLQFTATGNMLACGQVSGSVSVIDVDSKQVVRSFQASDAPVVRLRLVGNDRFVLATCFDATLRLLSIEQGVVVATAMTKKGTNERLAISPDGKYAITASGEDWDAVSKTNKRNGDYALRLWRLPEIVWAKQAAAAASTKAPANASSEPFAFVLLADGTERKFNTLAGAGGQRPRTTDARGLPNSHGQPRLPRGTGRQRPRRRRGLGRPGRGLRAVEEDAGVPAVA